MPLTPAQVTRIQLICNIFINVYVYVSQSRATAESLIEWRDEIFSGAPVGDPAPKAPVFDAAPVIAGNFIGIFDEFREFVDLIKASPGYTQAIGVDLMIVGTAVAPVVPGLTAPSLKVSTAPGYEVNLAGSMQSMDAMRVEYMRKGASTWAVAAFLTKLPGDFTITPNAPGVPETGNLRAIFIKKNADFGNHSPEYPITLS